MEIAFDFNDQITLGLDTELLLNWPKPMVAALPVSLTVSVVKFGGVVRFGLVDGNGAGQIRLRINVAEKNLTLALLPGYELDIQVHSLLGHRTKLKDVPKITNMIVSKLKAWFDKHCSQRRTIPLPALWPLFEAKLSSSSRNRRSFPTPFSASKETSQSSDEDLDGIINIIRVLPNKEQAVLIRRSGAGVERDVDEVT